MPTLFDLVILGISSGQYLSSSNDSALPSAAAAAARLQSVDGSTTKATAIALRELSSFLPVLQFVRRYTTPR